MATWARHAQARELVQRVHAALPSSARIMPLKGVLLAARGFVHPAERPIRDVDLLLDGLSMTSAVRALGRAGFELTDIPWSHGYLSVAHPSQPSLWVDLHSRPMPVGLGKLDARYMFANAHPNAALLGAPVYVPTDAALMVQLLANVVKDRIVHAFEHVPNDLACVARQLGPEERARVVRDLAQLSLARGAARALSWAESRTGEPALGALFASLVPGTAARAQVRETVRALERADSGSLLARARARAGADDSWLQLAAAAFTAASVATYPLRKAWLRANIAGDAEGDLR